MRRASSSACANRSLSLKFEPLEARRLLTAVRDLDGFTANSLAATDDGSSAAVAIGFELNFFGDLFDELYVNNNGNVTFDGALDDATPSPLGTRERDILAPFWNDVDTTGEDSALVTYGTDTIGGREAFGVNWVNVASATSGDLTNSFQLVLIDRSDVAAGAFDVEFNYDNVAWDTVVFGSGEFQDRFATRVGIASSEGGAGESYELIGSGEEGVFIDGETIVSLADHSLKSTEPGRYLFEFRAGTPLDDFGLAGQKVEVAPGMFFLGSGFEPRDLRRDQPDNVNAADTTNTDQIRGPGNLGLTGAGLTVGVWEAVEGATPADPNRAYVRTTHQELTGRVTVSDNATPSFSDHATHVAGTIAAAGVNAAALGMAPGVNILSFSSASDLTELAANGANIVASNHSYGADFGWQSPANMTFAALPGQQPDVWLADRTLGTEDPDFGKYDTRAQGIDQTLFNLAQGGRGVLSVWSAGNQRNDAFANRLGTNQYASFFSVAPAAGTDISPPPGWWLVANSGATVAPGSDGNNGTGFDSLPSSAVAKNNLVIGAIADVTQDPYPSLAIGTLTDFSSFGAPDDGRVKPDLVANGDSLFSSQAASDTDYGNSSGTSMSAPNVTGSAVLLIQHFQNLFGFLPRADTTKAALIHTAFDIVNTGPDYASGWGLVDAAAAASFLTKSDVALSGEFHDILERTYSGIAQDIVVPANGNMPFKVTIAWSDPAGNPAPAATDNNTRALVNDLDLVVIDPNGNIVRPWTLDPANPTTPAIRTVRNSVDNVEQIVIENPISGNYTVRVTHTGEIDGEVQAYSLAISAAQILPDEFEPNDTIATATFLGSDAWVTLRDLTIHSPTDVDFFRIAAHETGTLNVRIEFIDANGNLDLQIRDAQGNVIASSTGTGDIELLTIPVVSQERYFVEVFGFEGAENEYSLEIENFAAPVPTAVVLDPADDTGRDNIDDVTSIVIDTHFFVHADLEQLSQDVTILTAAQAAAGLTAGAAVEVFVNGVSAGFANAIAGTNNTLFEIDLDADLARFSTGGPNAAGLLGYAGFTNLVTAAVRIFDGQENGEGQPDPATGRTLQSPPLRVIFDNQAPLASSTPDMNATSDSGTFNNDNVTNIANPTIVGTGEANATIYFFVDGDFVGQAVIGSEVTDGVANNGLGRWTFTLPRLTGGVHNVTTQIEDRAGNLGPASAPLQIEIDVLEPNTPYLDITVVSDTGRHNADDVIRDNTPDVTMTTTDPNAAQHLFADNLIFRIFDRPPGGAETLIFDSFTALGGLTNLTVLTRTLPTLIDGVHNLKLEVEDRAGNISHDFLLPVTVDTVPPPVSFGLPALALDGLDGASDSGVIGQPGTFVDRITSDTTPTFFGTAEANSIVRLFVRVGESRRLIGMAVAIPLDGNEATPEGYWTITSNIDLNDPTIFPRDGLRNMIVTAEDLAGNVSGDQNLTIFIDTQGPQVNEVFITGNPSFDLFGLKPNLQQGPTPLVNSLTIRLQDLPAQDAAFLRNAIISGTATTPGVITVRGDHNGLIAIQSVLVNQIPAVVGQPALADIVITFAAPLPDDRFTLIVRDTVVDVAGNRLDGETDASEPTGAPFLPPSGDGQPGGDFVARFTVDTRPEIGTFAAATIYIDANGNFLADFQGDDNDHTNRDLTFALGITPALQGSFSPMGVHDGVFAGNFANPGRVLLADGYDKLAAYGNDPKAGGFRWLIDVNHDGTINPADGDFATVQGAGFQINGVPVAGEFDGNTTNGDEIGLFDGTRWYFDTNKNWVIDGGDLVVTGALRGIPIVGDFNGDAIEDLATWRDDVFYFSFGTQPGGAGTQPVWNGAVQATINWGLPGVLERPVAADMDMDGITDIGLYLPPRTGTLPLESGNWQFLISGDFGRQFRGGNQVQALNHPFAPAPLGRDLFAQFGDAFALPIVGNFDPPVGRPQVVEPTALPPVLGSRTVAPQSVSGETWYQFETLRGGNVSVAATGNVSVSLYDSDYGLLNGGSGQTAQPLSATSSGGGTYLIRVVGTSTAAGFTIRNNVPKSDLIDTNRNGLISSSDVLAVINSLLKFDVHDTPLDRHNPDLFMDTNLDGRITPADLLVVINYLINMEREAGPAAAEPPAAPLAGPAITSESDNGSANAVASGLAVGKPDDTETTAPAPIAPLAADAAIVQLASAPPHDARWADVDAPDPFESEIVDEDWKLLATG